MKVTLHTCTMPWLRVPGHPCTRVRGALDAAGVEYEIVKNPLSRGKRARIQELTGQRLLPVIQFEDGSVYRQESKDMAATIRAGRLADRMGGGHGTTA
jgi:hypothetical protein